MKNKETMKNKERKTRKTRKNKERKTRKTRKNKETMKTRKTLKNKENTEKQAWGFDFKNGLVWFGVVWL